MASYSDTVFENEVRKLISDKLTGSVTAVADGTATTSIEAYREQVGFIRGLRFALEACAEAHRLLAGEPPKTDAETRRKMASKPTTMGVL